MKQWVVGVLAAVLLAIPVVSHAQDAWAPGFRAGWDQNDADAASLTYEFSTNGGLTAWPNDATPDPMVNVSCTGSQPFDCVGELAAAFDVAEQTTFSLAIRAGRADPDGTAWSTWSTPLDAIRVSHPPHAPGGVFIALPSGAELIVCPDPDPLCTGRPNGRSG